MEKQSVTLITGSSRGIGAYLARHLLAAGNLVFGCSRQEPEWSQSNYTHVKADVTREDEVLQVMETIRKETGRLDNLINNAGISSMNHALLTPLAAVEKIMDVNFLGTFLFSRESAKLMRKNGGGRIVNFVSVALALDLEGESIYVASKAAVLSLTRTLARELAPLNITVNAIGPNPIDTDLTRGIPADKIEALINRQAIKRAGRMEDVANVVDFFLKPESALVTGQVIYLGGV